jgi:hypothetical protein
LASSAPFFVDFCALVELGNEYGWVGSKAYKNNYFYWCLIREFKEPNRQIMASFITREIKMRGDLLEEEKWQA